MVQSVVTVVTTTKKWTHTAGHHNNTDWALLSIYGCPWCSSLVNPLQCDTHYIMMPKPLILLSNENSACAWVDGFNECILADKKTFRIKNLFISRKQLAICLTSFITKKLTAQFRLALGPPNIPEEVPLLIRHYQCLHPLDTIS